MSLEAVRDQPSWIAAAAAATKISRARSSSGVSPRSRRRRELGSCGGGDEVRAARDRLRAAAVPETEWQDDGSFVRVQIADPDGYRIDLYAY